MSTDLTPQDQNPTTAEDRKRKRKALLAGGLVLGLGAAATLAAWTDDVFASGLFNTGAFAIEGSADGATYAAHSTEGDAAELTFELDALNMSPDQTVYAPFWIRTTEDTSLDADIVLSSVTSSGALTPFLTYQMASDTATCDETTTFDWVTAETAVDTVGTPNDQVELLNNAVGTPGTPIQVCIAVTLADDQDAIAALGTVADTSVVWGWTATSRDA